MKFIEACEIHLKSCKVIYTDFTYIKVKGYLNRSCELIGNYKCSKINKDTLLDLILHRKKINPNITNKTLNMYIMYVRLVIREETGREIPFKKFREEKKLPQILDDKTILQVYNFLDSVKSEESKRNKLMFMLLLDTGLRISELLSIQIDNIDFSSRMIYVTKTKSKEHRNVLFTYKTQEVLSSFIERNNITNYIFINLKTRKLLRLDSIQTICQKIMRLGNIKKSITPHKWRHTFASNFNDKNGNIFVLQKLLGHKKISTTQIYVTVSMKKVIEEYSRVVENHTQ
ncbi:MAG: Tyrosine recombinase XerD [Candidatus Izimaplasma bacterium HR2]|nr:MAG: Tyrosine recombinase XerD [Candidatus Izimaplasma bacterium HR2]